MYQSGCSYKLKFTELKSWLGVERCRCIGTFQRLPNYANCILSGRCRLGGDTSCCSTKGKILVIKTCKSLKKSAFGQENWFLIGLVARLRTCFERRPIVRKGEGNFSILLLVEGYKSLLLRCYTSVEMRGACCWG